MAHRHASAFQVAVSRQPRLQVLIATLATVSAAALVAAVAAHVPVAWWLLLALPAVAGLGWGSAAVMPRHLQWDGQVWRVAPCSLNEAGPAVEIRVVIDLGDWLLLRCHRGDSHLPQHFYLPLSRAALGASWGMLRATLYAAHTRASP